MKRIAVLSDTHGYLDDKVLKYLTACDEIWHAGDIGNISLANKLSSMKTLRAVWGNIDGQDVRKYYDKNTRFMCEDVEVLISHIVGYPGRYHNDFQKLLKRKPPQLLVAGHSHILKVMFDKEHNLLYVNPGAAGKSGMQTVRTLVRFTIDGKEIKDLEVVEIPRH